ncbi:MAG: RluA family pseudouridine synthase [Bdellovibrionales bacterium]
MSPESRHIATVTEEDQGLRLDKWLATLPIISSRSRAAWLIENGFVLQAGRKLKASQKVVAGTQIEIVIPPKTPSQMTPLAADLDVLFEDSDIIVINKPTGLVVHPAAGHAQDTLVNILLHHAKDLAVGFGENRPGIVHRLDRDTSGVLVVAKNDFAHQFLAEKFKSKNVHRIYMALVGGRPSSPKGTVQSFLRRHSTDRKKFISSPNPPGKWAITHYQVLQSKGSHSLISCRLETGRTHQIRVHMSSLGHPIEGDPIYGGKQKSAAPRLMLHASELGFSHPRTREEMRFKTPWPELALEDLREKGFDDVV